MVGCRLELSWIWGIEYERFGKEIYEYKRVDNDCLICYSLLNRF